MDAYCVRIASMRCRSNSVPEVRPASLSYVDGAIASLKKFASISRYWTFGSFRDRVLWRKDAKVGFDDWHLEVRYSRNL